MPRKRKPTKQRNMLDPHQPLLEEQENELIDKDRRFLERIKQGIALGLIKPPQSTPPKDKT